MKTKMTGLTAAAVAAMTLLTAGQAMDFDQGVRVEPLVPELRRDAAEVAKVEGSVIKTAQEDAKEEKLPPRLERFYGLDALAYAALKEGEPEKARALAQELIGLAEEFKDDWNYGNAIHHGNVVLGRVALAAGDTEQAKRHLLEAGRTPGSPQLDSFGPNLTLGKALLERGERDSVLEFLGLCEKFWKMPGEDLTRWRKEIRAGRIPDFRAHLDYGT